MARYLELANAIIAQDGVHEAQHAQGLGSALASSGPAVWLQELVVLFLSLFQPLLVSKCLCRLCLLGGSLLGRILSTLRVQHVVQVLEEARRVFGDQGAGAASWCFAFSASSPASCR